MLSSSNVNHSSNCVTNAVHRFSEWWPMRPRAIRIQSAANRGRLRPAPLFGAAIRTADMAPSAVDSNHLGSGLAATQVHS